MVYTLKDFGRYKKLLEATTGQLSDDDFFRVLAPTTNSVAVIVNHLAGNLISRYTDFVSSDGEKTWRHRDSEFDVSGTTREDIMNRWQAAWEVTSETLSTLTSDDITRTVYIRAQPLSVEAALSRSLAHFSYHVGEVVALARLYLGEAWQYQSILPDESEAYTERIKQEAERG